MSINTVDFSNRQWKRNTQRVLLSDIAQLNITALAGTSVGVYLRTINYRKFNKVTLFELDPKCYKKAVIDTSHLPTVKIKLGDISKYIKKDNYYDFDFETTINNPNVINILSKISKLDSFSMTFCVRKIGIKETNKIIEHYFPMFRYDEIGYKDGAPMRMYRFYKIN